METSRTVILPTMTSTGCLYLVVSQPHFRWYISDVTAQSVDSCHFLPFWRKSDTLFHTLSPYLSFYCLFLTLTFSIPLSPTLLHSLSHF